MILNEKNGVLHRARARVPLTARPFDLLYFLFFAVSTTNFELDFTLTQTLNADAPTSHTHHRPPIHLPTKPRSKYHEESHYRLHFHVQ